jgi:hypothetical protein
MKGKKKRVYEGRINKVSKATDKRVNCECNASIAWALGHGDKYQRQSDRFKFKVAHTKHLCNVDGIKSNPHGPRELLRSLC